MFKIGRAIKSYIRTNSGIAERNAFIDKVFRLLWETLSLFNKKTMKLYMTLLVKPDIINNSGGEFVKRLCLFAGFDKNNIIHDYVIYYIKKLSEFAEIHYIADCNMPEAELAKLTPYVKSARAYRHDKYDFGSWQELIQILGWEYLEQFDEIIFANDSCFAPVFPFKAMFEKMEKQNLDFWGNTLNSDIHRHIQSYFLVFSNKVIRDNIFRTFIENIRHEDERTNVIIKYEIRLTGLLENHGYKYGVFVGNDVLAIHEYQPYYKLFLQKSPFFKIKWFTHIWVQFRASYAALILLKLCGYPVEYIVDYIHKTYGSIYLLKNFVKCIRNVFWREPKRKFCEKFFKKFDNTVLITGGAGFIGSSLADALLKDGCKVVVVDNFDDFYPRELKRDNIKKNLKNKRYKLYETDIKNHEDIEKIFEENKIDIVYHLAAKVNDRKSFENPDAYFETNVAGTENILKCCVKHKVQKFIAASSSSVYGVAAAEKFREDMVDLKPISPYAESKLQMEKLIQEYAEKYGLKSLVIRPFTVYGPRQRPDLAICKFVRKINAGVPIDVYGDGTSSRDYTYIDDMVSGLIKSFMIDTGLFNIINIGSSEPVTLQCMINIIEQCLNKKAKINRLPNQKGDVPCTDADIQKAITLIKYRPETGFKQGIEKFIEYML